MLEQLAGRMRQLGLNKYGLAVMTDRGIESLRLQPGNACSDSYSVAKAFTMTAVGMLWDEGRLSLEDRVVDLLGVSLSPDCAPAWRDVTLAHALSHRVGLRRGLLDIDVDDVAAYGTKDYLEYVFRQPLLHEPGESRSYTDAAYYLLSRVVSALTGQALDAFLMARLFAPLDFAEMAWSRCPRGYAMGATGLYVSAADMVKLGWLYLNGGVYRDTRLLSEEWIALALREQYEFAPVGRTGLIGKGGMYGQMLLFSPERRFAAAWHGFDEEKKDDAVFEWIGGEIRE